MVEPHGRCSVGRVRAGTSQCPRRWPPGYQHGGGCTSSVSLRWCSAGVLDVLDPASVHSTEDAAEGNRPTKAELEGGLQCATTFLVTVPRGQ